MLSFKPLSPGCQFPRSGSTVDDDEMTKRTGQNAETAIRPEGRQAAADTFNGCTEVRTRVPDLRAIVKEHPLQLPARPATPSYGSLPLTPPVLNQGRLCKSSWERRKLCSTF